MQPNPSRDLLSRVEEAGMLVVGLAFLEDRCAICDAEASTLLRLRMRSAPYVIVAPVCHAHAPGDGAGDAELDHLECLLLEAAR